MCNKTIIFELYISPFWVWIFITLTFWNWIFYLKNGILLLRVSSSLHLCILYLLYLSTILHYLVQQHFVCFFIFDYSVLVSFVESKAYLHYLHTRNHTEHSRIVDTLLNRTINTTWIYRNCSSNSKEEKQ